jgi:hypothetical protein
MNPEGITGSFRFSPHASGERHTTAARKQNGPSPTPIGKRPSNSLAGFTNYPEQHQEQQQNYE